MSTQHVSVRGQMDIEASHTLPDSVHRGDISTPDRSPSLAHIRVRDCPPKPDGSDIVAVELQQGHV